MIPVGLASFLASAFTWPFLRLPLPLWWAVMLAGGLLSLGWGVVILLPKAAKRWGVAYMAPMSILVPIVTVSFCH